MRAHLLDPEALAWGEEMDLSPTVTDPDGGYVGIRSPIRLDSEVPTEAIPPPRLDEHGRDIRAEVTTSEPTTAETDPA